MKKNLIAAFTAAAALLVFTATSARADDMCAGDAQARAKSDAKVKQAQELEKAGRAREAYTAASRADQDCASDLKTLEAILKRSAKVVGTEEEGKSRFAEAFDWYRRAESPKDAGRMQRKLVEAKPEDINVVRNAIGFFEREQDPAQAQEVRAHAAKNIQKWLAAEEKAFASTEKNSLDQLGRARDWAHVAGSGEELAKKRAEQRGDTLFAEESPILLRSADNYYAFADNKGKQNKVRDKARALGDRASAKGEAERAVEYYHLAGDNDKAEALRERSEQQQAKTEEVRKKKFSKEQDELEKELDLK